MMPGWMETMPGWMVMMPGWMVMMPGWIMPGRMAFEETQFP